MRHLIEHFIAPGRSATNESPPLSRPQANRFRAYLSFVLSLTLFAMPMIAQDKTNPVAAPSAASDPLVAKAQQPAAIGLPTKGPITLADAMSIFLQQNLGLISARYDIDLADAEKLTAKIRPDPSLGFSVSDVPLKFSGPFIKEGSYDYTISETFELGGKRAKRIDAANANSQLARAHFETVLWQMTNDLKRKFYTVLLNASLLELAKENQATLADTIKRSAELADLGEISGLDLQRLEVEKFTFDTDVANNERDYEVSLRDLRLALGGDYRTMDIRAAGSIDYYQPYEFGLDDLLTKALASRPDLKAAKISEIAADSNMRLQNSLKIPDITLTGGVEHVPLGTSTYIAGAGITLPLSNRNQGERAKALIQKQKSINDQLTLTNQVTSDVDKALVAFNIQKHRVDLYRNGVLNKVNNIQDLTEYSLKVGESSTLDLLDAIRTRRETLSGFYQALFDYEMALLDLELATATALQK
jgi:cobalt-zinc-cadmium efflux system outer membrane protein